MTAKDLSAFLFFCCDVVQVHISWCVEMFKNKDNNKIQVLCGKLGLGVGITNLFLHLTCPLLF